MRRPKPCPHCGARQGLCWFYSSPRPCDNCRREYDADAPLTPFDTGDDRSKGGMLPEIALLVLVLVALFIGAVVRFG